MQVIETNVLMLEAERAEIENTKAKWDALLADAEDVFTMMYSRPLDETEAAALAEPTASRVISRSKVIEALGKDHKLFDNIEVDDDGAIHLEAWLNFFHGTKSALGRRGVNWLGALAHTLKKNLTEAMEAEAKMLAEEEARAAKAEAIRKRKEDYFTRMLDKEAVETERKRSAQKKA